MQQKFEEIKKQADELLKKGRPKDLLHTTKVVENMTIICESENLDKSIYIPAAMLHDIGWAFVVDKVHFRTKNSRMSHMGYGAIKAIEILEKVNYPEDKLHLIAAIISEHDHPSIGLKFFNKETRFLREADRLWMVSKDGFWFDCERFEQTPKERIDEIRFKFNLEGLMSTKIGKSIFDKEIKERIKEAI